MASITIVGLGPGDAGLITRAAWQILEQAGEVYVRTQQHPAVAALPPGTAVHSFDPIYAAEADFAAVYQQITAAVLELGARPEGVVYAVPGDPTVGEATTWLILHQAAQTGIPVQVAHGVSFVEPVCWALALDPLERDGLQVVDAMVAAASHVPPCDPSRPALLAQCYSRSLASDVKLTLLHSYPADHPVTVLRSSGMAVGDLRPVALAELDHSSDFDHLTTLYVPPCGPHGSFARLQEIVAHLRAPDGCPWDREQTLQTLRKDLLEETYELLEALDADDDAQIGEELGDVSLILAMLAQIAAEEERFKWPELMELVSEKLIRRHPHVFGDVEVSGSEEVIANWARIKQEEARAKNRHASGSEPSPLASVPRSLPALVLASKYLSRLERAALMPDLSGADPLARQLWDLVAKGRRAGRDAETELRQLCQQVAATVEEL